MLRSNAPVMRSGLLRRARRACLRATVGVRLRYYRDGFAAPLVRRLPTVCRRALCLDDESAVVSRRVEVGSGERPSPGYLHVDMNPHARHVDAIAPAWSLPLPDGWATELVAIHCLEHIAPSRLEETLREWRRVIQPGGTLQVHVPNGTELMSAYLNGGEVEKWRANAALLGMYANPSLTGPLDIKARADHQVIFDEHLLESLLVRCGFLHVVNVTSEVTDIHTTAWSELVPHCSLVYRGRRAEDGERT